MQVGYFFFLHNSVGKTAHFPMHDSMVGCLGQLFPEMHAWPVCVLNSMFLGFSLVLKDPLVPDPLLLLPYEGLHLHWEEVSPHFAFEKVW